MLLIRSQDKNNLVNTDLVKCISIDTGRTIIADYGQGFTVILGRYKTCERVIKVLDLLEDAYNSLNHNCPAEVQRGMAGNFISGMSGYGFVRNGTYYIPQE